MSTLSILAATPSALQYKTWLIVDDFTKPLTLWFYSTDVSFDFVQCCMNADA